MKTLFFIYFHLFSLFYIKLFNTCYSVTFPMLKYGKLYRMRKMVSYKNKTFQLNQLEIDAKKYNL